MYIIETHIYLVGEGLYEMSNFTFVTFFHRCKAKIHNLAKSVIGYLPSLGLIGLAVLFTNPAYAYLTSPSLGDVAKNVTGITGEFANMITAIAFVIGFGFAVGAIVKYKAYRDNPQNIPLSIPITLFFVALAFLFLGILLSVSGTTVFGPGVQTGALGVTTFH